MAENHTQDQTIGQVFSQLPVEQVLQIARSAGESILAVKAKGQVDIITKADDSPVTNADHASHQVIEEALNALELGWPVISEEGEIPPHEQRANWQTFWLVDPLDGTQEFINGTDRFGVNIALVHQGRPVFGVMHFPEKQLTFYASKGHGAYVVLPDGTHELLPKLSAPQTSRPLRVIGTAKQPPQRIELLMEQWKKKYNGAEWHQMSGPLKFCWLAWGKVDAYPRFGPSAEWDTAPPEVILHEVGYDIVEYPSLQPITYNKPQFPNAWFICGHPSLWQDLQPTDIQSIHQ